METHTRKKCPKRVVCCMLCKLVGEYQVIAGEHANKCPSFPLPCPLGCGAELIRQDLESHCSTCPLEPVLCPFSGLGCKTKVCRQDLDKHIETSTLQHMTVLAESHTALQMKVQAIASVLKDASSIHDSSYQIAHIYTILTDTSTLKIGDTINLALFESPGHHYIIVSQEQISHKFKLEWALTRQWQAHVQLQTITCKLYSIHEAGYPVMTGETKFDFSLDNNQSTVTIPVCLEKLQKEKPQKEFGGTPQLIEASDLNFLHQLQKHVTITIKPHNPYDCVCSVIHYCISCSNQCYARKRNHKCQWCGRVCKKN